MTVTSIERPSHTDPEVLARLGDQVCALAGQIAAATSRFLALLAEFDVGGGWIGAGVRSCLTGCRGGAERTCARRGSMSGSPGR